MTKLFALAAAAAATVVFAAATAHAEGHQVTVLNTTIRYNEADLATADGAAKLLRRIDLTARQLCASSSPAVPHMDAQARTCRDKALGRAVATLSAPLVTAAYDSRPDIVRVAGR